MFGLCSPAPVFQEPSAWHLHSSLTLATMCACILSVSSHCAAGEASDSTLTEESSSPLCWKFIHVSTIFVKPNTGFWQLLLYFSVNCFHLILNYFFKKNFKKHPKVFWMYKLNYVLSGNLTVLILGDWILCCGRRVELVLSCVADGLNLSPITQEPHGKPEPAVLTAGECWWHTVYVQQPRVVQ